MWPQIVSKVYSQAKPQKEPHYLSLLFHRCIGRDGLLPGGGGFGMLAKTIDAGKWHLEVGCFERGHGILCLKLSRPHSVGLNAH